LTSQRDACVGLSKPASRRIAEHSPGGRQSAERSTVRGAAENLMLAATALGLGACCIGAAVDTLNTSHVKAMLRIPADVHAVAPIVVGVPAGCTKPAARAEPEIVSWT
jgi:nitroreductase